MTKPTVGRTVHYVDQIGDHLAAVVVKVDTGATGEVGRVHLTVFGQMPGQVLGARNVVEDQDTKKSGTWHYPERAEEG